MGHFKQIREYDYEWVLVEHYLGDYANPFEVKWVRRSRIREVGMPHAFDEAEVGLDPDRTDPMIGHKK